MKATNFSLCRVTLRAMLHRRWTAILMVAVVLAGSFTIILLNDLEQRQLQALDDFIASSEIRCMVTDPQGMGQGSTIVSFSTIQTLLEEPPYTEYIKDLEVMTEFPLMQPAGYTIRGIRSLSSDPALSKAAGATVEFYSGYAEDLFLSSQQLCLIPAEDAERWPDRVIPVSTTGLSAELTIIGTVKGGADNVYYIPFAMEWDAEEGLSYSFFSQGCSFLIKDNTRLEEIKAFLWGNGMFQEPKWTNRLDEGHGLLIQDKIFQQNKAEMESNLQLLQILQPVLLILVGCVGFFTGHLTTRSRIKEFAVMRCLGMKKGRVFRLAILEQLMLSLVGLALGLTLGLVISGSGALEPRAVANAVTVALIFLVGTGLAATRIAGINVMKLMKVED